jgi:protein-S-isoprenylcysteine O-methyltransferase Ste14
MDSSRQGKFGILISRILTPATYTSRMPTDTFVAIHSQNPADVTPSLPMRLWLAAPDWLFRVLGFGFFALFTLNSAQKYWQQEFSQLGPWCNIPGWGTIRMPWVPVLVDLTYLLIAISFLVRFQPKARASDGRVILITLFTAFAPFIFVLWMGPMLGWFNPTWEANYNDFLWRNPITWQSALTGSVLITLGNIIDVWGYLVLCRSFGIIPEARELKTTGPYRFVRHPVYLGQFLAQAGVLLFFARMHAVWIGLYCVFVGLQLYRSKLEDRVLANAFGEEYEAWRRRTFWFV